MKRKIVAGNWKMNLSFEEAQLLASVIAKSDIRESVEVILAPPTIYLDKVLALVRPNQKISVAAQNCHQEDKGAYTGEVSAEMLGSMGVRYVILGHSERRKYCNETDLIIKNKIDAALSAGLSPIFCCGETAAERKSGKHFETVLMQLNGALMHLSSANIRKAIIAYEPVWAIGTGVTATTGEAGEMHAYIRQEMEKRYGSISADIPLLYGGSCNASNAAELFALPDVNGGLIGGASLKAAEFSAIMNSFR